MKKVLTSCGFVLLYFAIFGAATLASALIVFMYYGIYKEITGGSFLESFSSTGSNILLVMDLLSLVITFFVFIFVFFIRKKSFFAECGFSSINYKLAILFAVAGIAMNFAVSLPAEFLAGIPPFDASSSELDKLMGEYLGGNIILVFLGIGILGPVIEEVMCRGLVLNELRKIMPLPFALVLQGLLFGALHMNLFQSVYAAFMGVLIGLIYIWAKTIWAPIIVHIANNSISIVLENYDISSILKIILCISGAVVMAFIMYICIKLNEAREYKVAFSATHIDI